MPTPPYQAHSTHIIWMLLETSLLLTQMTFQGVR